MADFFVIGHFIEALFSPLIPFFVAVEGDGSGVAGAAAGVVDVFLHAWGYGPCAVTVLVGVGAVVLGDDVGHEEAACAAGQLVEQAGEAVGYAHLLVVAVHETSVSRSLGVSGVDARGDPRLGSDVFTGLPAQAVFASLAGVVEAGNESLAYLFF